MERNKEERIGTMKETTEQEFQKNLNDALMHLELARKYYYKCCLHFDDNNYYEEDKRDLEEYQKNIQDVKTHVERTLTYYEARLLVKEIDNHEKDEEANEQYIKYLHEFERYTDGAVFHHKEAALYYNAVLSGWKDKFNMKEKERLCTPYKRHIKEVTTYVEGGVEFCEAYMNKRSFEKEKKITDFEHFPRAGMYTIGKF